MRLTTPSLLAAMSKLFIAALFVPAAIAKIAAPQPFIEHMGKVGLPGVLLPAVIALELGGAIALLLGWRVRLVAIALAVFCLLAAAIFHSDFGNKAERTLFFKDLAIAGGLFAVAAAAQPLRRNRSEIAGETGSASA